MEMSVSTPEPYEKLSSNRHWIETLFPPQFTFQDLLKGTDYSMDKSISPTKFVSLNLLYDDTESRRQRSIPTLKEVQQKQGERKKRNLTKTNSRDEQHINSERCRAYLHLEDSHEILNADYNGKYDALARCIWNAEDITQLRITLTEMERDRWRLRARLRSSEEQLNSERGTRRRLQALLEDREGYLEQTRKEAARHSLAVRALRVEARSMNIRLQELTRQNFQQAEVVEQLQADLREAKDRHRQIKQERSDLAWELGRALEQERVEAVRLAQAARVEYEAALASLQKQVEEAGVALREEMENHGRSRMALELLRRHLSQQQHSEALETPAWFVSRHSTKMKLND